MSTAPPAPTRFFRGRMARTMLLILLPLFFLPLLLIGGISYFYGYNLLSQQANTLLSSITNAQASRINSQIQNSEILLDQAVKDSAETVDFQAILSLARDDPYFISNRLVILDRLQATNRPIARFNQFLIVKPDGTIHISTNRDWHGKKITERDLLQLTTTTSTIGFAPEVLYGDLEKIDSFVTITSVPYTTGSRQEGELVAVVMGIAESPAIKSVIDNATFYSDVNYFVTLDGEFIGINPYPNSFNKLALLEPTETHRQSVLQGLSALNAGETGTDDFISFLEQPVIAAYTQLPELNIGWVTEVPQTTIYAAINTLLRFSLIFYPLILLAIAVVIWFVTRRLTQPILDLSTTVQSFAAGNWEQRAEVKRQDEVGLLATSFNQMADELSSMYTALESQVEERTEEVQVITKASQIAISSTNLDELLRRTIDLLIQHFDCTDAALYLTEGAELRQTETDRTDFGRNGQATYALLRQSTGSVKITNQPGDQIPFAQRVKISSRSGDNAGSVPSFVGWTIAMNRPRVGPLEIPSEFNGADPSGGLTDNRVIASQLRIVEAAIPIAVGDLVLGAINLYSSQIDEEKPGEPFSNTVISDLQTLANQIGAAVRNFQLLEITQIDLQEANMLYQATYQIAQAETEIHVLTSAVYALQQSPYASAILHADGSSLRIIASTPPGSENPNLSQEILGNRRISISSTVIAHHFSSAGPVVVSNLNSSDSSQLPQALLDLPIQMGCNAAAFLPVVRGGVLLSLLVLGSIKPPTPTDPERAKEGHQPTFTLSGLQPYTNLIALVTAALEKIQAQHSTQRRLIEMESLWNISQSISIETDLSSLFEMIHHQTEQIMGEVSSFGIALYEPEARMILIPYLFEEGEMLDVPPFPLGEGLTSILLRTGRPLLLVEGIEEKVRNLGAKTIGMAAKSWLGVPLMVAGDAMGAIIVQDIHQEHRFDEEDQRLLSTMAAQVAVVVRNARLLETSQRQAEQERILYEITNKIRRSVDIQSILKTTADELGTTLRVRRARIELGAEPAAKNGEGNGGAGRPPSNGNEDKHEQNE